MTAKYKLLTFFLIQALSTTFIQPEELSEDTALLTQSGDFKGQSPLGEGVAKDSAGQDTAQGGWSEGETSPGQDTIQLPEIVTYIDAPVVEQRQVFTASDIERLHVADLPAVIERAGVQLLSYGTYGLEQKPSIRGFTDETVRVVIDGICMNNAQTGTFDFSTLDIASVESVEIVRGGFTEGVEDEGAVGGVIYITTRKQSLHRHLSLDSSILTFANVDTRPLALDTFVQKLRLDTPMGENAFFSLTASGAFAQNRFLYENYSGRLVTQQHAKVTDGSAAADYTCYFGNGNSLSLRDSFYAGDKHTPNVITSIDYGRQKDKVNTCSISLFTPQLGQLVALRQTASYIKTRRSYRALNDDSLHDIDDIKYSATADFYTGSRFRELVGLSFDWTQLDSTNSGRHNQASGVVKSTSKAAITDWLSLSLPLAVKFCGQNLAFTPKLGLAAKFQPVELLLDGYRMTQFPNMDDLYWESGDYHGNPDLEPEKGWGADFTVNVKRGPLPLSVQFFTNYYEDKIAWSGGTTQNFKSAFYFGIDLSAEKYLFDRRLLLSANGEYLYTKLLDKSDRLTYGKRIMWTPDFEGTASACLNFASWDLTLTAAYTGKRYKTNLNTAYLEPYTLVHVSANLKLWQHVTPYAKIENLFNTRYTSVDGYAMPGASYTVGVKMNW